MVPEFQHKRFAVDETPYCLWDDDIHFHNSVFIKSIDPKYFQHVAQINSAALSEDTQQYAAVALRTSYSHGLETFFSLLAATIQAPDCVMGWMLRYENKDLFSVVGKISSRNRIKTKLRLSEISWDSISALILSPFSIRNEQSEQKNQQFPQLFARLWERFAIDFMDKRQNQEYNSVKHGFRLHSGGIKTYMGLETERGVPAPAENMHPFIVSEHGGTIYIPENINTKTHFQVRRQSMTWNVEKFPPALELISLSITVILNFLKVANGIDDDDELGVWIPESEAFELPWNFSGGNSSVSFQSIIKSEWIKTYSKEEILSVYDELEG